MNIRKYFPDKVVFIENIVVILILLYSFWCERISLYPSYDVKYWLMKTLFAVMLMAGSKALSPYIYIYMEIKKRKEIYFAQSSSF